MADELSEVLGAILVEQFGSLGQGNAGGEVRRACVELARQSGQVRFGSSISYVTGVRE